MKRHPSWEAWSAWVDGESARAEEMRRHLDSCPACMEQVKALRNLSSGLQRLPALDVHPAFTARVMARAKETQAEWTRPWWRRFAIPLALTASFLLLIGVAIPWRLISTGNTTPSNGSSFSAGRLAEALMDFTEEAASDSEIWELAMLDSITPEDLLADVAQTDSFAQYIISLDEEADLDGLMTSLDDGEMEAFQHLVLEYGRENRIL